MHYRKSALLAIFGLLMTGSLKAGTTEPASTQPALPPEIRSALQSQADIEPAITLYWSEEVGPISPQLYGKATGFKRFNHHTTFTELRHIEFIWQPKDNHYFEEFRSGFHPKGTDRRIARWHIDYSYDGKNCFIHTMNPNEVHGLNRMTLDEDSAAASRATYLNAVGLHPPLDQDELERQQTFRPSLLTLLDVDHYRLVAQDAATLDSSQPLVRLRLEPPADVSVFDTDSLDGLDVFDGPANLSYWLDPQNGYALRRLEIISAEDGKLQETIDCTDFHRHGRLYLPHDVKATYYENGSPEPTRVWTLHLQQVNFKIPSADLFTISDSTPGTWIIDGQVIRIVQKDGSLKIKEKNAPSTTQAVDSDP